VFIDYLEKHGMKDLADLIRSRALVMSDQPPNKRVQPTRFASLRLVRLRLMRTVGPPITGRTL
jgi:hypothetical protein